MLEIDALRGIAAVMVVLFHYTTKFDEFFKHSSAPFFSVPWGYLGVNLFFMISGFVIFMTLSRTRSARDFVVSRFSRLYPAYWVAAAMTFALVAWMGLPGKEVSPGAALLNLLMFHGLFKVPHVDGVYWTLEIELLFYAWALLAFGLRSLERVHLLLLLALGLQLVYSIAHRVFGVDLSWTLSHVLILPYIAWFSCGIMVYRLTQGGATRGRDLAVLGCSIASIAAAGFTGLALLAAALSLVIYLAAKGQLSVLRIGLLGWLGEVSYSLYLLHENIGWALLLRLKAAGVDTNVSIAITLVVALSLAWLVTRTVEKPAMQWIRTRYRRLQVKAA